MDDINHPWLANEEIGGPSFRDRFKPNADSWRAKYVQSEIDNERLRNYREMYYDSKDRVRRLESSLKENRRSLEQALILVDLTEANADAAYEECRRQKKRSSESPGESLEESPEESLEEIWNRRYDALRRPLTSVHEDILSHYPQDGMSLYGD